MRRALVESSIGIQDLALHPMYDIVCFAVPEPGEQYLEFTGSQCLVLESHIVGLVPKMIVKRCDSQRESVRFEQVTDMDRFVADMRKHTR